MYFPDYSSGDGIDGALAWTQSCVDSCLAKFERGVFLAIYLDVPRVSVVSGYSPANAQAKLPDSVFERGNYLVAELQIDNTWKVVDRQGFAWLTEQAMHDIAQYKGGRWLNAKALQACKARHPAGKMLQAASS